MGAEVAHWLKSHECVVPAAYSGPESRFLAAPQDFSQIDLRRLWVWPGNGELGVDVVYVLRQGGQRKPWTAAAKHTARQIGLKNFGDSVAGSTHSKQFMGYAKALGSRLDRIFLALPTNYVPAISVSHEQSRWGSIMSHASWENKNESGRASVEFPNGEYAEWWRDGKYSIVRWSCALSLRAVIGRATYFFSQVKDDDEVALKLENEPNIALTFLRSRELTEFDDSGVEFFRADSNDVAVMWSAADKNPPHYDVEFGEATIIYQEGADDLLSDTIRSTATPLIGGLAMTLVYKIKAENSLNDSNPSSACP